MLLFSFFLICIILDLVRKSTSIYIGGVNSRMRNKLVALDKDLTLDAIANVRRVHHFKAELYEQDNGFHIGKLLLKIRSKFGRMVRLHAISHDHYEDYDINKHILHLAEIQHLAMDIDNLVQMILDYEWVGKPKKLSNKQKERYMKSHGSSLPLANSTMHMPHMALRNRAKKINKKFVAARTPKLNIWRNNAKYSDNNGGGFDSDGNK